VPGSDERKLAKVPTLLADSVVLDLEDGVPADKKAEARTRVSAALQTLAFAPGSERAVRINCVGSGLEHDDLAAILTAPNLEAIVIPKVEHAWHVQLVSSVIDARAPAGRRSPVRLIACIESARGLLNAAAIAAADPRLDALVFASEDYCADVGMIRTAHRRELLYARSAVVTAAAAHGLQAIDLVCIDYKSEAALRAECQEGREMGFTGKQAIHPNQIAVIQELFAPRPAEIDYAQRIVAGYTDAVRRGLGALTVDGKMVDRPVVKWAEKVLARARRAGSLPA